MLAFNVAGKGVRDNVTMGGRRVGERSEWVVTGLMEGQQEAQGKKIYKRLSWSRRDIIILISTTLLPIQHETETEATIMPYSLDQMPLSISHRSQIGTAPPDVLKEIVVALKH